MSGLKKQRSSTYARHFYEERRNRTTYAAQKVLSIVADLCNFESVVDFGCGTGTWLANTRSFGSKRLLGIEGPWLHQDLLDDPSIPIRLQDFEAEIQLSAHFDLAISLEVAEHLSQGRAPSFIRDICVSARAVLFSAAIPHQGGDSHVNEQWQGYWANLFLENGYLPVDAVRPRIWQDERIPFYYRQNVLMYVPQEAYEDVALRSQTLYRVPINLNIVHPRQYEKICGQELGVKESISVMARFPMTLFRAVQRRISERH